MKKFILVSILLPCFAFAGEIPEEKDITIRLGLNKIPTLNSGYDSRSQNFRGYCIKGTGTPPTEGQTGSLSMKLDSSQDDAARSLGIQAGGRYRTGVTEVSASADLAQSSVQNGYSVNFTYKFDATATQQYEQDASYDFNGDFGTADQRTFFQGCGDEYVSGVSRSARLLVNLSVSFSSQEEAQSFAAEFKLNSPTVGVNAAIQQAASNVSKKTTMKFYSVQMGGYPGYSGKAICPDIINAEGKPAAPQANNCAEPVVQCGFGKFPECIKMLENIIGYSAHDFADQVTDKQTHAIQNYVVTEVHVQPYLQAGVKFPRPPSEQEERTFQEEVKSIADTFEKYFAAWVLTNRVTNAGAPRLSTEQSKKMIPINDHLHKIVNHLVTSIEECYKQGYDKCAKNRDETNSYIAAEFAKLQGEVKPELENLQTIDDINDAVVALSKPVTFAQFCDLATPNYPAIKTTIDSLKQWAVDLEKKKNSGVDPLKGDECATLQAYYAKVTDLDLSGFENGKKKYPVAALTPISMLKGLKTLNLSNQNVSDIESLKSLVNLTDLNLDGNLIEDICKLDPANLKNLKSISLANNKVEDISCLGTAPNLATLDARGNSEKITKCPLKSDAGCKFEDFTKSVAVADIGQTCGIHVSSAAEPIGGGRAVVAGGATPAGGFQTSRALDIYERDTCYAAAFPLNVPRANATLTTTSKGILVVGGYTQTLEMLEGSNLKPRLLKAQLKTPRALHTATLLNDGRVLIVGGYTDLPFVNMRSTNISATFEIYNPVTDTIDMVKPLTAPRAEHTATKLPDGRVLITGGYQDGHTLQSAEIIDPDKGVSTPMLKRLNSPRFGHAAVSLGDGRVMIAGGLQWKQSANDNGELVQTVVPLDSVEIFESEQKGFRMISDKLSTPRGLLQAQKLTDGHILLIAGSVDGHLFDVNAALGRGEEHDKALNSALSVIDMFDPVSEGVYKIGNLAYPRAQAAIVPLADNYIAVIGGMGSNTALLSGELLFYKH